jgi:hypothetical protein
VALAVALALSLAQAVLVLLDKVIMAVVLLQRLVCLLIQTAVVVVKELRVAIPSLLSTQELVALEQLPLLQEHL